MLSTKDANKNTPATGRRALINELKKKHEKLFNLENLEKIPKFIPKMAYVPKTGEERVISFFPSEIMGGEDIYTEFVSRSLEPEDSERRLWKWPFNPEFDTEYQKTEKHQATGHRQYLIPVEELINVAELHFGVKEEPQAKPEKKTDNNQLQLDIPQEEVVKQKIEAPISEATPLIGDAPINQLTIKDKAAIDWKQPVSDKPWLNALIKQTFNLK